MGTSDHAPGEGANGSAAGQVDRHAWAEGPIELSFVMPFYNPGNRLREHAVAVVEALEATGLSFEVLAVSDGSTDGSFASLAGVRPDRLRRIELPVHRGKGEALRTGLSEGRGEYLGFIDADGDLPAGLLAPFVETIRTGAVDIVVGSKRHPGSVVHYPLLRRVYSWGYQQLTRLLFGLEVRDTQTGLKVVRRSVLQEVLPLMREERFAFDLELLVLAHRLGYDRVAELPVRVERRLGSTVSPGAVARIVLDTLGIWWRLRLRSGNVPGAVGAGSEGSGAGGAGAGSEGYGAGGAGAGSEGSGPGGSPGAGCAVPGAATSHPSTGTRSNARTTGEPSSRARG